MGAGYSFRRSRSKGPDGTAVPPGLLRCNPLLCQSVAIRQSAPVSATVLALYVLQTAAIAVQTARRVCAGQSVAAGKGR